MKKFKSHTLSEYLDVLSRRTPIPGGGSAAALVAATGAALVSMVADYSRNRTRSKGVEKKIRSVRRRSERIRKRLLDLVDLDAQGYLKVVKARGASTAVKKKAMREAAKAPREVCQLCYQAIQLVPYLVKNGNPYLISDIKVAAEMLFAGFNAAHINVEINS
ncbi:MAG TPA: cyclodeaminase/cyclohydrolase family protein [Candidatus Omnitrophota bacterium]|nr:cyclodeaminase/cyclohydrolase family protein [Candidatus Omnitrophota bacterium]